MSDTAGHGWRFEARDAEGRRVSGVVEVASEGEARKLLTQQMLSPVTLEPVRSEAPPRIRGFVDPRALAVFTRQFATLVDAALPLLTVVEMLASLTTDRPLKAALQRVAKDINGGASLSDALSAHPHVFPPIYVHMVGAGEVGGTLPQSLERVAVYMETSQSLRERLMGAMVYPAVVLSVAVMAVGAILTFVVPVFAELFASEGLALPISTRVLLAASDITRDYWPAILVAVASLVLLARQILATEGGRRWSDFILLRVPVFGNLRRKAAVARLTRAMASMLHSGVMLSDVLLASARISGSGEVEAAVMRARDSIHAGSDLATPLARAEILPPLLAQMVKVGEESGRLEEMLDKVADFFEMEVKAAIDGAMKALEPALIVILGVVLGGIVAAMYTPVFDLMTSIG
ncbi:MAG: type II secretion system F family protein [Longimicrobiales bacterium]|nr:type II secretion system F family protein [Longimicrobiales bacterium]